MCIAQVMGALDKQKDKKSGAQQSNGMWGGFAQPSATDKVLAPVREAPVTERQPLGRPGSGERR